MTPEEGLKAFGIILNAVCEEAEKKAASKICAAILEEAAGHDDPMRTSMINLALVIQEKFGLETSS